MINLEKINERKEVIAKDIETVRSRLDGYEKSKEKDTALLNALLGAFQQCDAEVVYMFAYGSWYVYDNSTAIGNASYQFIELEEALYNVLA